jgi:hypothetical protein
MIDVFVGGEAAERKLACACCRVSDDMIMTRRVHDVSNVTVRSFTCLDCGGTASASFL